MTPGRDLFVGSTLLVGALVTTGALAQAAPQPQEPTPVVLLASAPDEEDEGEGSEATGTTEVVLEQAVSAAQDELGVTDSPSSAELYTLDGGPVWEVVIGDQEVTVDADTAEVLGTEAVEADAEAGDAAAAAVLIDEAVRAAQDALGVTDAPSSAALYRGDGSPYWEVVIGPQEVTLDAGDAQVLEITPVETDGG